MSNAKNDQKMARIHGLPLFRSAGPKALEHIASAAEEVTIKAGQILITQDHLHNEGLIIERGTAEVLVDGEVVAEIPEGEMIGELALFDRGPASATVRAKTEMDVLLIPYNRFDQILDENPAMVKSVAKELARRLRAMDATRH